MNDSTQKDLYTKLGNEKLWAEANLFADSNHSHNEWLYSGTRQYQWKHVLNENEYKINLCQKLLISNIFNTDSIQCKLCQMVVNNNNNKYHALVCQKNSGIGYERHNQICKLVSNLLNHLFNSNPLNKTGYNVFEEKRVQSDIAKEQLSTKRGDVEIQLDEFNSKIIDVTISNSACQSNINRLNIFPEVNNFTSVLEKRKRNQYSKFLNEVDISDKLVPFIFTTTGKAGAQIDVFFDWLKSKAKLHNFESIFEAEKQKFFQISSVIIAKATAKYFSTYFPLKLSQSL